MAEPYDPTIPATAEALRNTLERRPLLWVGAGALEPLLQRLIGGSRPLTELRRVVRSTALEPRSAVPRGSPVGSRAGGASGPLSPGCALTLSP